MSFVIVYNSTRKNSTRLGTYCVVPNESGTVNPRIVEGLNQYDLTHYKLPLTGDFVKIANLNDIIPVQTMTTVHVVGTHRLIAPKVENILPSSIRSQSLPLNGSIPQFTPNPHIDYTPGQNLQYLQEKVKREESEKR